MPRVQKIPFESETRPEAHGARPRGQCQFDVQKPRSDESETLDDDAESLFADSNNPASPSVLGRAATLTTADDGTNTEHRATRAADEDVRAENVAIPRRNERQ
jgi:hypothetical protein